MQKSPVMPRIHAQPNAAQDTNRFHAEEPRRGASKGVAKGLHCPEPGVRERGLRSLSDKETLRSGFSRDPAPHLHPFFTEDIPKAFSNRLHGVCRT